MPACLLAASGHVSAYRRWTYEVLVAVGFDNRLVESESDSVEPVRRWPSNG